MIDPIVKQAWMFALRTTHNPRAYDHLRTPNHEYDALGILADAAIPGRWVYVDGVGYHYLTHRNPRTALCVDIDVLTLEELGILPVHRHYLRQLNRNREATHSYIADWIERHL